MVYLHALIIKVNQMYIGRYTLHGQYGFALMCLFVVVYLGLLPSFAAHPKLKWLHVCSFETKTAAKQLKLGWNSSYSVRVWQKRSGTFPLLWLLYILGSNLSPGVCVCVSIILECAKNPTRDPPNHGQVPWWILGSPISLRSISKLPWMRCTPCCWGTLHKNLGFPKDQKTKP